MERKNKKEKDDPRAIEELLQRKFRARCRFRAFARLALANAYWLAEFLESAKEETPRVKAINKLHLRRPSKHIKLTASDKALLYKPGFERTSSEKRYIYRLMIKLSAFHDYPHAVERKLAGVVLYRYFGPERVIFREGHEPKAMYFILTGKVVITKNVFDDFLQDYVITEVERYGPGFLVGDQEVLHGHTRTTTCTTKDHCEFLVVMDDAFHRVLCESVQRQWDHIKWAMKQFTYFDSFDEVLLTDACMVSKIKHYRNGDTILGDSSGFDHFVYFLLDGCCTLIENLMIYVSKGPNGRKLYKLYDPADSADSEEEEDILKKYNIKSNMTDIASAISLKKTKLSSIDDSRGVNRSKYNFQKANKSADKLNFVHKSVKHFLTQDIDPKVEERRRTRESSSVRHQSFKFIHFNEEVTSITSKENSFLVTFMKELSDKPQLETYFMQVCQYFPKSSFNLGENMNNRRIIVSSDSAMCLIIPRVWLMKNNPVNIWNRILRFLEKKIPTTQQLFKEFLRQRRWESYRDRLVEDIVKKSKRVNCTSIHDVPFSVRIEEKCDY